MPAAKYDYPVEKTCPACLTEWDATTSKEVEEKEACSPECSNALRAWEQRGASKPRESKHPSELDGMVKVICANPNCADPHWIPRSREKIKERHFCEQNCYNEYRSQSEEWRAHLTEIAPKGRDGWTEESMDSYIEAMSGENNPSWKGGVTEKKRKGNYKQEKMVRCPDEFSEMARSNGYVPVHRLKVAMELGRSLTSEECVHHVNHDNHDNRLENLELYPNNRIHKLVEGNREEYASERLWPEPAG